MNISGTRSEQAEVDEMANNMHTQYRADKAMHNSSFLSIFNFCRSRLCEHSTT